MTDLDVSYIGALTGGILSFLSPCILPIVPPYLCFLAGLSLDQIRDDGQTAPGARRRVLISAVMFVLGFSTIFVAMGASSAWIGTFVAQNLDWLSTVAGAIILVLGLHFTGLIRIPILYRQATIDVGDKPAGFVGAYLVGLAFGFGWTPCAGPVLAAILFTAGSFGDPQKGALLLAVYSLGIGIPFILAALFVGPFLSFMKRFRRHLGVVETVMGILLIATGVLFMTGQITEIGIFLDSFWPEIG